MSDFSVITGASKGIGFCIADYLAEKRSEDLVLLARGTDNLNKLKAKRTSIKVYPVSVDLTHRNNIDAFEIPSKCTRLKALVLNAGTFFPKGVLDSGKEEIYTQFELNFFSLIHLVQKLSPYFSDGFTQIFITASSASYVGIGSAAMYAASKHAVLGFARSLRQELEPRKIRVTSIAPGSTWSSSWEGSGVDPNTLIDPYDIAKTIEFVMSTSVRTNFDEIILNPVG